jgi:hypothetical protein
MVLKYEERPHEIGCIERDCRNLIILTELSRSGRALGAKSIDRRAMAGYFFKKVEGRHELVPLA